MAAGGEHQEDKPIQLSPEIEALEASLDQVLLNKLLPLKYSNDPNQYELAVRLFSSDALHPLIRPLVYRLADEVAMGIDSDEITRVVASLLDERILNAPNINALNYAGATCIVGLFFMFLGVDEVAKMLPFIASLDFHNLDPNVLRPTYGNLGNPTDIEEYKKYLSAITNEKMAKFLEENHEAFNAVPDIVRSSLLNTLLIDPDPDTFAQKFQLLTSAVEKSFIPFLYGAEAEFIVKMLGTGITVADLQICVRLLSGDRYLQMGSDYRLAVSRLFRTASVREVQFIAETIPNCSQFRDFPTEVQRAIINRYDRSRNEQEIMQIITVCSQPECNKLWSKQPYGFASLIKSCGYLESPEQYAKALDLQWYGYHLKSPDLDTILNELIPQLMRLPLEEAYQAMERILEIYQGNTLPQFAKQFKIFEQLYFSTETKFRDTRFFRELAEKGSKANLSPFLTSLAARIERYSETAAPTLSTVEMIKALFWRDLLHIAIDSADPSLYAYLSNLQADQALVESAKKSDFKQLSRAEVVQIEHFFNRLEVLVRDLSFRNNFETQAMPVSVGASLSQRFRALQTALRVPDGGRLTDQVMALYLAKSGYVDIEAILQHMDAVKAAAHTRNAENERVADAVFDFHEGDLIKVVNLEYVHYVLLGGFRSGEFLGSVGLSASSDRTPFDSDFWRLQHSDVSTNSDASIVETLKAGNRGEISFVIKNRGQFSGAVDSDATTVDQNLAATKHKYELIHSRLIGIRHYGVRTGIASTEIDAIILNTDIPNAKLSRLYFQIANNGFYIPVCDKYGNVLFKPEDYQAFAISSSEVKRSLSSQDFFPEELLSALETAPYLKQLFELHSGVSDGYSLRKHTLMVMSQFEKYFATSYDSMVLSIEHIRLLLALHDIGKSLAAAEGRKQDQHEFTKEILQFALPGCGLSPQEGENIMALMDQDIIGAFFRGVAELDATVREVISLARLLKIKPIEVLAVLKILYIADAGSYTADASGDPQKNSLGYIFSFTHGGGADTATFSEEYQALFAELETQLHIVAGMAASATSENQEVGKIICPNCKKEVPSWSSFCSDCGTKL